MSCDCLTGYQSFCLVEKKSSCFYFNKMETNVILRMHELLQAVDLDGIKAFYDDLQARIDAGKIVKFSLCLRIIFHTWNLILKLMNLFFPLGEQLFCLNISTLFYLTLVDQRESQIRSVRYGQESPARNVMY